MAPNGKPTLTYFDSGGRAEAIRLAFYIGGIDFEDRRIPFEEFRKVKVDYPFGQVPVLEIDGDYTSQAVAILFYAGMRANLVPEDPILRMKVMEFILAFDELGSKILPSLKESVPEKKRAAREVLTAETIPFYLERIDKLTVKNGKSGFCIGDKLTIADLFNYYMMGWFKSGFLDHVPTTIGDKYSKIKEAYEKLLEHPKVKEWRDKHQGKADTCGKK